jgi:DNA (cytosine-5)-methyltransferase 1
MGFDFIDLFSGIGGFHAALSALGGECKLASEIDPQPARVYEENWGLRPEGDIRELAADPIRKVPNHALLVGGFPCQPFSKSGHQRGMSELRGRMFNEILKVLEVKKPSVVALENVRNIAGPRQRPVWDAIVQGLREAGYRTPSEPCVFSPHLLSRELGGSAQTRDRVYILGTYVGRERALRETEVQPTLLRQPTVGWDPKSWDLFYDVLERGTSGIDSAAHPLSDDERLWISTWDDFLRRTAHIALPGFPLWSRYWTDSAKATPGGPLWKQRFEELNIGFFEKNRGVILSWLEANPVLRSFPESRQKFEWQAGDSPRSLRAVLLQLRPSGIRVKKPDYAPALVAMGQTPIIGRDLRRMTVREAARLQGFPDWFEFGGQRSALSFKQLGNAVHVGAAYHVIRAHILRDREEIASNASGRAMVEAVLQSPEMCIVPRGPVRAEVRDLIASNAQST